MKKYYSLYRNKTNGDFIISEQNTDRDPRKYEFLCTGGDLEKTTNTLLRLVENKESELDSYFEE